MSTRAGRLLADIIMSIAKGYIDNLREETLKGLYGRLKQGIYPFKAPKGYIDTGGGNVKEIDPILAPLIKEAFQLYSTGDKSLDVITRLLAAKGLLSPNGKKLSKNTLSLILHNPFYIGLMKVKGEVFKGKHRPLISTELYNDVQKIFSGHFVKKTKNTYMYRGIFNCSCGRKLVGEKQKQWVYYRCHISSCNEKTLREDRATYLIESHLRKLLVNPQVMQLIEYTTEKKNVMSNEIGLQTVSSIKINIKNVENRIDNLTDMVLDGTLEQEIYLDKKEQLFNEKTVLLERQKIIKNNIKSNIEQKTRASLEQSQSLYQLYKMANKHEKRSLIKKTFSNLVLTGGRLLIATNKPYSLLLNNPTVLSSCQEQGTERNKKENFSLEEIVKIAEAFIEQAINEC